VNPYIFEWFFMRLTHLVFDLDNTLIDFVTFKKRTALAAAKAMRFAGLQAKEEEVIEGIFEIYSKYGIEYQKTFGKLLWEKFPVEGLDNFERIQQAGILAYLKEKFVSLKTYPEVEPTLDELLKRGFKLCILTDAPRNKAWQRMELTGLSKYFSTVTTFDDSKAHKPNVEAFNALFKKGGFKPENALIVGDNPERDILGGKNAGMKTALAKYGQISKGEKGTTIGYLGGKGEKADFELGSFREILNLPI
jgi:putative hydrolase of the HAD superfamily